jgi:peptidyl-prolyl cis-trans isomerase A (cyclophilin A)
LQSEEGCNSAIFGEVVDADSKAVVDALAKVPTDMRDRPLEDVVIESIDVVEL